MVSILTEPWKSYVAPFRVYGHLFYVGNRSVCSWLVDSGDGLILFDTTFPQTVYQLVDGIYRLGFQPSDIRYVLHTHGLCDHMGALA